MSENLQKLIGVAVMAVLVVVGVAVSSGGDDDVDFTRNFGGCRYESPYCRAELARLAPAFLEQAAPKANHLNRDPIFRYVPDGRNDGKVSIEAQKDAAWNFKDGKSGSDIKALSAGKASVLEGRGVDGKGGTSSLIMDSRQVGVVSGRKASFRANGGMNGVAERIGQCVGSSFPSVIDNTRASSLIPDPAVTFGAVNSLKNVLVTSYTADVKDEGCGMVQMPQESQVVFPKVGEREAELLAECMESKVGGVFLKSHIEAKAADCVATVMPALSPERAKRLGTYWQTPEQLTALLPAITAAEGESG